MSKLNFKIISLILGILLISSLGGIILLKKEAPVQLEATVNDVIEIATVIEKKEAVAKEIYPLFECPCCGKAISECSCGMAKERMAFIDGITSVGISEEEAILTYVKKYSLGSFMEEEREVEFRQMLTESAPEDRAIISLNKEVYDLGNVSQSKGIVTTFFEIKNEGGSDLIINRLETSCGCTSASIVYQEKEGPKFNMPGHDINEKIEDWQITIASGAVAQLKVYYDPNMHVNFRGTATRTISIFSNDPIDFQKEVQIELNQVP